MPRRFASKINHVRLEERYTGKHWLASLRGGTSLRSSQQLQCPSLHRRIDFLDEHIANLALAAAQKIETSDLLHLSEVRR